MNYHTWKIEIDETEIEPIFFFYALRKLTQFIEGRAHGASALVHTQKWEVEGFEFPLPLDHHEQSAIAAVLSDTDALLAGLDRLIAKKRDLKQAAMQQLLTGKTRLPGFDRLWDVVELNAVAEIDPENLSGETPPDFKFNYIALEDVDRGRLLSSAELTFSDAPSRARRKIASGDLLVSTVRPGLQSHLLFNGGHGSWVCSTGFCVVRSKPKKVIPAFLFALFFSSIVTRQIDTLVTGSNYPAISSADVAALEIAVPEIEEQAAIADVLSDMDAELLALMRRREKTQHLKQAMMQELLTGNTRLV